MPEIVKGLEIPKSKSWARWKFAEMASGDCMVLETEEEYKQAQSAAYMFAKRNKGYQFTCRRDGDGGKIWRK